MVIVLTILHVLVCLFLILVVLLQSGKAADLAGAFGGMGSQTAFGPRGAATVLSKATTVAAIVFMLTSLTLSIMATRQQGSTATVLDQHKSAPKKAETGKGEKGADSKMPSVTIFPEGTDPAQGQTIPLPQALPENVKKAQEEQQKKQQSAPEKK